MRSRFLILTTAVSTALKLPLLRWGIACILLGSSVTTVLPQQEPLEPIVTWVSTHSIPLTTVEPTQELDDLQRLKPIIDQARVVALGEGAHGVHEFLAFRNRLFEFLVEEMGFTAIAVETGFSESVQVDDYVLGEGADGAAVAANAFHWAMPTAIGENQALIDWIRQYNARPTTKRKVRFYGIDLTGGRGGVFAKSRLAVETALTYIEQIDTSLAQQIQRPLAPLLDRFNSKDYQSLTKVERNTLTGTIGDLVGLFERQRVRWLAQTSQLTYQRAYRHAVVARQLDGYFRVSSPPDATKAPSGFAEEANARGAAMADNLTWALQREGPQGRVLVFAHNVHVKKGPLYGSHMTSQLELQPTFMGEYLDSMLGDEMVVFGFTFHPIDLVLPPAKTRPADESLARVGLPLFAFDLGSVPDTGPIADWAYRQQNFRAYNSTWKDIANGVDAYMTVIPIESYDVLIFVNKITRCISIE